LALAALALVVFGAYDNYPTRFTEYKSHKNTRVHDAFIFAGYKLRNSESLMRFFFG